MYDEHTGQMIGFVSVEDIEENLAAMELQVHRKFGSATGFKSSLGLDGEGNYY